MKKLLYPLLFLPLFISCDQVDEGDRYIPVQVEVSRRILLEEFTGQRCTNCPAAHEVIKSLEAQYGDDLIVVSIHAGTFGIESPDGLMQPEGEDYAKYWDVTAYPAGVVDREGTVMTSDKWGAAILEEARKETDVELNLNASLSDDLQTIYITTGLQSSSSVSGKLQLWVVENDIVGFQIDGSERLYDYVHNNVFRACVNGLWGQDVSLEPFNLEEFDNSIAVFSDPESEIANWNVENLYIVGFLYNDSGVLQVNRAKVELP